MLRIVHCTSNMASKEHSDLDEEKREYSVVVTILDE